VAAEAITDIAAVYYGAGGMSLMTIVPIVLVIFLVMSARL